MNTDSSYESPSDEQHEATDRTSSVELIATISVLAFVVIAAASFFVATPRTLQAAASPQAAAETAAAQEPAERPFHERHRVQPAGEAVDAPTF